MYEQVQMDPKEAIVNLNGLASRTQQIQDHPCNGGNNGIDMTSNTMNGQVMEHQTNMDIDGRNIISSDIRTETPNKQGINLIDGDINNMQSSKNRRTRGVFGMKD
ncbi:unnamed protein product [Rotaria sordida]|uniref:Uncharacterized protein n=1 Tax=Rotaria sordida TaxID=392033 RepID=A0A815WB49_9BILA|nr:unnamed protein product [Rotaria sordida]CAF1668594.1 unnamed protein product [Rotaria sordida]